MHTSLEVLFVKDEMSFFCLTLIDLTELHSAFDGPDVIGLLIHK